MTTPESHDEQLAEILERLTDSTLDWKPDLEELTNQYPHLADDLRELWGTIMVVDAVASYSLSESSETVPLNRGQAAEPPPQLGDYILLDELGRGGMGVVYRAKQESLERDVAVKLILHGTQASEEDQARFQAEVSAAAKLEHPHIVPIYEVGDDKGWQYFCMKLIDGTNLAKKMLEGPMPERQAVKLVMKIARAISFAHEQGIIHRDLKPANILLDKFGEPHVSDFGLAKQVSSNVSLTQTGAILGTPSYMAPEQAVGSRGVVGPLCDVYSLGAILYALLTGKPPFQGPSPFDTLLMVLEQDPLPPRLLNGKVSRDLEMIVLRCLQKPSELRYASADALADDLRSYLDGESISARSGHLRDVMARVFRETHHATILENWGVLWMWHAAVVFVLCVFTNWLHMKSDVWPQAAYHWPYVLLWGVGLAIWGPIFWALRHRAGPVTAVERQIAHAWGGSIVASLLLFIIESIMKLPVLFLSPALCLITGMVFTVKASILAGSFYWHATLLFAMAPVLAWLQAIDWPYGITLFGFVSAMTFFLPGWKYYSFNKSRNTLVKND